MFEHPPGFFVGSEAIELIAPDAKFAAACRARVGSDLGRGSSREIVVSRKRYSQPMVLRS